MCFFFWFLFLFILTEDILSIYFYRDWKGGRDWGGINVRENIDWLSSTCALPGIEPATFSVWNNAPTNCATLARAPSAFSLNIISTLYLLTPQARRSEPGNAAGVKP